MCSKLIFEMWYCKHQVSRGRHKHLLCCVRPHSADQGFGWGLTATSLWKAFVTLCIHIMKWASHTDVFRKRKESGYK